MQEEIIRDCQCGFQQNGSVTDHIFWICQIRVRGVGGEKEYSEEASDSVRWEVLYNILIELGIPMTW